MGSQRGASAGRCPATGGHTSLPSSQTLDSSFEGVDAAVETASQACKLAAGEKPKLRLVIEKRSGGSAPPLSSAPAAAAAAASPPASSSRQALSATGLPSASAAGASGFAQLAARPGQARTATAVASPLRPAAAPLVVSGSSKPAASSTQPLEV